MRKLETVVHAIEICAGKIFSELLVSIREIMIIKSVYGKSQ